MEAQEFALRAAEGVGFRARTRTCLNVAGRAVTCKAALLPPKRDPRIKVTKASPAPHRLR